MALAFYAGQLINIDVSAEKNGYFADTGASFVLQDSSLKNGDKRLDRLCRDGKRALWTGIRQVKSGAKPACWMASPRRRSSRARREGVAISMRRSLTASPWGGGKGRSAPVPKRASIAARSRR